MTTPQRIILSLAGIIFLTSLILLYFFEESNLLTLIFIIGIPTGLFYFAFSKQSEKQSEIKKSKQIITIKNKSKDLESLEWLSKMTQNRLYKLSSFSLFGLFVNTIYIEEKQVVLEIKQSFFSSQEYHIAIKDILMPVTENGLFFSALKIEMGPGGFLQNPPIINYLKKNEALKAKRIIMGLIMCTKENIDLSNIPKSDILEKIEEIGRYK